MMQQEKKTFALPHTHLVTPPKKKPKNPHQHMHTESKAFFFPFFFIRALYHSTLLMLTGPAGRGR